ncbi:MAG: protein kinase [Symbiobacteriaceae bacterium]|nr:protein kinase [Symbiobacteriaceae bacterium]
MGGMGGRTLDERYEVLEKIGDGGMAVVYRARDLLERRIVAVKILRQEHLSDEDFIRRFRREAEASLRLHHPHLVEFYDVNAASEPYYLVMEYVDGVNLQQLISGEQLSYERILYIALQIIDGLSYAHANKIVHRDIKPQNILVASDDTVKITDFGIAVLVTTSTLVNTRNVIGSVHYLSPEQAKGEPITEQSDLYSLGVVLYEMISGVVPFQGDSPVAIIMKHTQEEPLPLSEWRPDIPAALEDVVITLLAKDPRNRYRHALDVRDDLEQVIEELPELEESSLLRRLRRFTRNDSANQLEKRLSNQLLRWLLTFSLLACLIGGALYGAWELLIPKRQTASMPNVVGMHIQAGLEKLQETGFLGVISEEVYDSRIPEGQIIRQDMQPGLNSFTGSEVGLVVSLGKETFPFPNVVGQSEQQANLVLSAKKLLITPKMEHSATVPENIVMQQIPEANTMLAEGAEVTLIISSGPQRVQMPLVLGMSFDDARKVLEQLELLPAVDTPKIRADAAYSPGAITAQLPQAGEMVAKNSRVELWTNPTQGEVELVITFDSEPALQVIRVEVDDQSIVEPSRVVYEQSFPANSLPRRLNIPVEPPAVIRVYRNGVLIHMETR